MRPTAFYKSILIAVDKPLHLVVQVLIPTQIQIFFSSADVPSYIHFGSVTHRRRIRRGKSGIFEKKGIRWSSALRLKKLRQVLMPCLSLIALVRATGYMRRNHWTISSSCRRGPWNQRLSTLHDGPFPHFVASSATMIFIEIHLNETIEPLNLSVMRKSVSDLRFHPVRGEFQICPMFFYFHLQKPKSDVIRNWSWSGLLSLSNQMIYECFTLMQVMVL